MAILEFKKVIESKELYIASRSIYTHEAVFTINHHDDGLFHVSYHIRDESGEITASSNPRHKLVFKSFEEAIKYCATVVIEAKAALSRTYFSTGVMFIAGSYLNRILNHIALYSVYSDESYKNACPAVDHYAFSEGR